MTSDYNDSIVKTKTRIWDKNKIDSLNYRINNIDNYYNNSKNNKIRSDDNSDNNNRYNNRDNNKLKFIGGG